MKNSKRIIASLTALALVAGMSACAQSEKKDETTVADATTAAADSATTTAADTTAADASAADTTAAADGNTDMTITWMSHYDLNPAEGKDRSAELAMFEDEFGGKIEYQPTTWDARFEDLSVSILSGNSPDIFPYEWIAFPCGVMKNQYQSIDSIVDFSDPLWSDMADAAEGFVYKDQHYVAPFSIIESLLLIYDRTQCEEEGIDDPYELYQAGNWDWDAFKRVMTEYVNNGEDRLGIVNAFGRSMVQSTGETFVTYKDGQFLNNIKSANIDRVQEFLSGLAKEGLTGDGTYVDAATTFTNGNVMFYGSGRWDIERAQAVTDHDIFVVPMPKDPQSDTLYVAENLQGHMWVAGSTKAQAVKTWFECNRKIQSDEALVKETTLAQYPGWSEELYNAVTDLCGSKFTKVFDYGYGVSEDMSTYTESLYNSCCFDNTTFEGWAATRDSYSGLIDAQLADLGQ